jgi:hypothetical protein
MLSKMNGLHLIDKLKLILISQIRNSTTHQTLINSYHMKKNLWQYSSPINGIGSVQVDSMGSQECVFEALII